MIKSIFESREIEGLVENIVFVDPQRGGLRERLPKVGVVESFSIVL